MLCSSSFSSPRWRRGRRRGRDRYRWCRSKTNGAQPGRNAGSCCYRECRDCGRCRRRGQGPDKTAKGRSLSRVLVFSQGCGFRRASSRSRTLVRGGTSTAPFVSLHAEITSSGVRKLGSGGGRGAKSKNFQRDSRSSTLEIVAGTMRRGAGASRAATGGIPEAVSAFCRK